MLNGLEASGKKMVARAETLLPNVFEEMNGVFRKDRQWTVYVELDDTSDHEVRHMQRMAEALGKALPKA